MTKQLIDYFAEAGYQVGPKTLRNKALEEMLKPIRRFLDDKRKAAQDRYATGEAYIFNEIIHDIDLATNRNKSIRKDKK
jgi:hypothetical protein